MCQCLNEVQYGHSYLAAVGAIQQAVASGRAMPALITLITSALVANSLEVELIFKTGTLNWRPDTENRHIKRSTNLAVIIIVGPSFLTKKKSLRLFRKSSNISPK